MQNLNHNLIMFDNGCISDSDIPKFGNFLVQVGTAERVQQTFNYQSTRRVQ